MKQNRMVALRGVAWCSFADFALLLALLFFLALCAEQVRHAPAPVLDLQLPALAGAVAASRPAAMQVEWDGASIAVDGCRLGSSEQAAVMQELARRVAASDLPVQLLLPEGPYAQLLAAIGQRRLQLSSASR
jgi:hypothetical protein